MARPARAMLLMGVTASLVLGCLAATAEQIHGEEILASGDLQMKGSVARWRFTEAPGETLLVKGRSVRIEAAGGTTPNVTGVVVNSFAQEETPQAFEDFTFETTAWMARSDAWILPRGNLNGTLIAGMAALRAAVETRHCVNDDTHVRPQPGPCTQVGGSGQIRLTNATGKVTGSFHLVLWGWNGTIQGHAGAATLWSGQADAGPGLTRELRVMQYRELDLYVEEGELVFGSGRLPAGELLLRDIHLDVAKGSVTLAEPTHDPQSFPVPASARVGFEDGHAVVTMDVARPQPTAGPLAAAALLWPWLAAAVALGIATTVGITYLLLRPRDPVLRALHRGDPAKAARIAASLPPAQSAEEGAIRAVAYIQSGDLVAAERAIGAYALPAAERSFLTACLRARQGRAVEARAALAESIRLNPAYAIEATFNVDLAPLAQDQAGRMDLGMGPGIATGFPAGPGPSPAGPIGRSVGASSRPSGKPADDVPEGYA